MKRLIYSPYVHAFVNSDQGVVDISPYLVSGTVNRKVNQVSPASLILRNPVIGGDGPDSTNLVFTEFSRNDGTIGPMFHPMDPLIILMTRLQSHQVQVFTGYIDKAPYIQLYPGLCKIDASCTLKRLLYTQWDAALPFVRDFLQQYGWQLNSDSGIVNPSELSQRLRAQAGQLLGQFNDGSLGALLYAVLNVIGEWDGSTIWIEALPPQIKDLVVGLYQEISTEVAQGQTLFTSLLTQILGSASLGNGGPVGASGNITNANKIVPTMVQIAKNNGLPPLFVVTVWLAEGAVTDLSPNGSGARGYFQFTSASPYGFYPQGQPINYPQDAGDLSIATNLFCGAAAWAAQHGLSDSSGSLPAGFNVNDQTQWETWAETVQQPGAGAYSSYWSGKLAQAAQLITQYGSGSPVSGVSSLAPASGASQPQLSIPAQLNGTSSGGKQGQSSQSAAAFGGYVNPFQKTTNLSPARIDMGVDYFGNGPILAIGNGQITFASPNTGWTDVHGQRGAALVYQLSDGPFAGKFIYVAEDINILKYSGPVQAGDVIAEFRSPSGIETGWATGTADQSLAAALGQQASGDPGGWASAAGLNFSSFLQALGAPAGTPNSGGNGPNQSMPVGWPSMKGMAVNTTAGGGGSTASSGSAMAAAFSTFINLPSIFSTAEALAFTGKRSFMADQPLFPFIEQLCQASLRNFMSMPNGNFFAFFPDYFGIFGRKYYWEVRDIEIIDGRIDLSDDPLVTHVAVAGDVTQYHGQVDVFDMLLTSGIFSIFDAITTGYVQNPAAGVTAPTLVSQGQVKTKLDHQTQIKDKTAALAFLRRYGARPYVEQAPMIRSPIFELFLAFQKFMLLWAKQFQTTFELTFMPEIFPGGLIALPDHHIQLYVEEVVHNFDYTSGFTTTVNVSSPSKIGNDPRVQGVSQGMARPAALSGAQIDANAKANQLILQLHP